MDLEARELNATGGLVCAHHHLYSALARGMLADLKAPRFRTPMAKLRTMPIVSLGGRPLAI